MGVAPRPPHCKQILLNRPANPTGRVLPRKDLERVAAVCAKHKLLIVSDEIYRAFTYVEMTSIAELHPDTVTLVGHSKSFGMTGWRLGYAVGPSEVISAMTKVQQYSFVCAPSVTQYAALACPQVDLHPYIDGYKKKRDLMVGILGKHFEIAPPDGAFYLWAKAPTGWKGSTFVEHCIANNLLVIPGSVFSERDTHFRICYTVPDAKLKEGAEKLCTLAEAKPK